TRAARAEESFADLDRSTQLGRGLLGALLTVVERRVREEARGFELVVTACAVEARFGERDPTPLLAKVLLLAGDVRDGEIRARGAEIEPHFLRANSGLLER